METTRAKVVSVLLGGALIALAATAIIHGAASSGASSLGASFNSVETDAHSRSLEFSTEAARASAEHEADREKCARLAERKRKACYAAAKFRNARQF